MGTALAEASKTTRFERRRSSTQAALCNAALELFRRKGVRATTIEEICERADVAQRTFFNHFASREELYAAIARQRATEFAAMFEAQCSDERPLRERLPRFFAAVGRGIAAVPAYRELVGEMLHVRLDGGNETVRREILGQAARRFVVAGVERGEITRAHRPEILADILLGALITAIVNWSADASFDIEGELYRTAAALVDLLAPQERRAPERSSRRRRRISR